MAWTGVTDSLIVQHELCSLNSGPLEEYKCSQLLHLLSCLASLSTRFTLFPTVVLLQLLFEVLGNSLCLLLFYSPNISKG